MVAARAGTALNVENTIVRIANIANAENSFLLPKLFIAKIPTDQITIYFARTLLKGFYMKHAQGICP
jgi:hypothetical protein